MAFHPLNWTHPHIRAWWWFPHSLVKCPVFPACVDCKKQNRSCWASGGHLNAWLIGQVSSVQSEGWQACMNQLYLFLHLYSAFDSERGLGWHKTYSFCWQKQLQAPAPDCLPLLWLYRLDRSSVASILLIFRPQGQNQVRTMQLPLPLFHSAC